MLVKKLNRVLQIHESDKASYLKDGWSVIHEKTGKVLEKSGSTEDVQLEKLQAENKKLKTELKKLKEQSE
jgi:cell division protein FtsB